MSVIIQGYQLREIAFGQQAVTPATTLPQTATGNLFTVSGGAVLVTSLIGLVTTVIQNSDPQLTLGTAPTTGTAETAGIAATEALTSLEVGAMIGPTAATVVSGTPDVYTPGKLAVAPHAGTPYWPTGPFVVSAGHITWTTGASKTGALKWYLTWVPLDTGASVAAS